MGMKEGALGVGFIGCGRHATRTLFPCLQHAPINLVATCDLVEELAQANARTFGAERFYTDYRAMLDHEKIDACFVAVGPDQHPKLAIDVLEAGLHVFLEKPPGRTVDVVQTICDASQANGRCVMVAFKKRFCPVYQRAKEVLSSPHFGRPTAFHARLGLPLAKRDVAAWESGDQKVDESWLAHLLLDYFIHHFDLARYFMGDIESLYFQRELARGRGSYSISLVFRSGAVGTMILSGLQSPHSFQERLEIFGEGANLVVDDAARLTIYRQADRPPETSFVGDDSEGPIFWEPHFSLSEARNKILFIGGFAGEVIHFSESILAGHPPQPDIWDGREAVRIAEALSGPEGEVVVRSPAMGARLG